MIYFRKDDCKIVFNEGRKLKFRNVFAMLLSVNSDLTSLAIMMATTIQIPLKMLDVFLSIFLFSNVIFERAIYYF